MQNKILACALLGLGLPYLSMAKAPAVSVDIAPLHSLVSQVMQTVGEPALLIPAQASPHEYELRPSQARALSNSDVVFWMGESFTPWLEKALENVSDDALKIEMLEFDGTITYEFREGANFEGHDHHGEEEHHDDDEEHHEDDEEHHEDDEEHHEDEDEHHDHEGNDPHAWLDPENAKAWVIEIARVLSIQDPENASVYARNAKTAIKQLDQLIKETKQEIGELSDRKFIVFHDAYQYYEKRFDILASGSISVGDAQDPSPARIKEIQKIVNEGNISCVFTEPQYNPGIVKNIFAGTSVVNIGVMDPLGASITPGVDHYIVLIKKMTQSLVQCKK